MVPYMKSILIMKSTEAGFEDSFKRSCVQRNVDLESVGLPFKLLHNLSTYTSL